MQGQAVVQGQGRCEGRNPGYCYYHWPKLASIKKLPSFSAIWIPLEVSPFKVLKTLPSFYEILDFLYKPAKSKEFMIVEVGKALFERKTDKD